MKEYVKSKIRNLMLHEINISEKINNIESNIIELKSSKVEIENNRVEIENSKIQIEASKISLDCIVEENIVLREYLEKMNVKFTDLRDKINQLELLNYADANDYKAFYNLLLNRDPEEGVIRLNEIKRNELFSSIIFSPEAKSKKESKGNESETSYNSYSQVGEDCIIRYILDRVGIENKTISYLDIGACLAKETSNTYLWYELGARGVLVDANPTLCENLVKERPGDIVLNRYVSDKADELQTFYILNGYGMSCGNRESVEEFMRIDKNLNIVEEIQVKSITINKIWEEYFKNRNIDILSIDIEGLELTILKSIDFKKNRAKIIICEMIPYDIKLVVNEKNQEILAFMDSVGYIEYAFTGVNSIFIDKNLI